MARVGADVPFAVAVEEVILRVAIVLTDRQRGRGAEHVTIDPMRGTSRWQGVANVCGPQENVRTVELLRRRRHNGPAFNGPPGDEPRWNHEERSARPRGA